MLQFKAPQLGALTCGSGLVQAQGLVLVYSPNSGPSSGALCIEADKAKRTRILIEWESSA